MNIRWNDRQSTYFKYGVPLLLGTSANVVSTFITMPLQRIFNVRQLHPDQSYPKIIKTTLSPSGLRNVYNLSSTALATATLQSISFLGISLVVMEHYKNEEHWKCGLKAGLATAATESIATAWGLQKMVSGWEHANVQPVTSRLAYWRSLQGTIPKNVVANTVTLTIYLYANDYFQKYTNPTIASAGAGVLSAFLGAPIIAPFSNLQTHIQNDPSRRLLTHAKDILGQSLAAPWKGTVGRGLYKMADGMIKFGLIGAGRHAINTYIPEEAPLQAKHHR